MYLIYCKKTKVPYKFLGIPVQMTPDTAAVRVTSALVDSYKNQLDCLLVDDSVEPLQLKPNPDKVEQLEIAHRTKRDKLLFSTPALHIAFDTRLSVEQQNEIKRVRDALYDLSAQPGWPITVEWPALNKSIMGADYPTL